MKRASLAVVSALMLTVPAAQAADMALKAPPPPVPVCNWCGWYVGVNAGANWNGNSVQTIGTPGFAAATFGNEAVVGAGLATTTVGNHRASFIGGAQIGYNYQLTNSVIGWEADIQGLANHGSTTVLGASAVPGFPTEAFTSASTVSKNVNWLGTVRGRFGFLANPNLLLYATGGLAYGGVKANTTIVQSDSGIQPGNVTATYAGTASTSTTRVGWTVGVGGEWMLAGNWSAKIEYLYYDLGKVSYGTSLVANAAGFATPTWVVNTLSSTRFNGSIARVGLDYHFGGPK